MTSKLQFKSSRKYPIVLTQDIGIPLSRKYPRVGFANDKQLLGCVDGDELVVFSGYACDGYSPVISLRGWHLKLVPSPRGGLIPAVLHDFLVQMSQINDSPISKKTADKEFYSCMRVMGANKVQAFIYYAAVRSPIGALYTFLGRTWAKDKTIKVIKM